MAARPSNDLRRHRTAAPLRSIGIVAEGHATAAGTRVIGVGLRPRAIALAPRSVQFKLVESMLAARQDEEAIPPATRPELTPLRPIALSSQLPASTLPVYQDLPTSAVNDYLRPVRRSSSDGS